MGKYKVKELKTLSNFVQEKHNIIYNVCVLTKIKVQPQDLEATKKKQELHGKIMMGEAKNITNH